MAAAQQSDTATIMFNTRDAGISPGHIERKFRLFFRKPGHKICSCKLCPGDLHDAAESRQIVKGRLHRPDVIALRREGFCGVGFHPDIDDERPAVLIKREAADIVVVMALAIIARLHGKIESPVAGNRQTDAGIDDVGLCGVGGSERRQFLCGQNRLDAIPEAPLLVHKPVRRAVPAGGSESLE